MSLERQILFWAAALAAFLVFAAPPRVGGDAVRHRHRARLPPRSRGAPPRADRPQPSGRFAADPRRVRPRRRARSRRRRADPGQSVDRLHAEIAGLRHAPASARGRRGQCAARTIRRGMARFARARQFPLGRTDSKVDRRFRRARRAMAAERRALARLRRRRDRQFLLVHHRHAGRRLLHPRRLEQDDRDARRLAAARPSRRLARDRFRDQRRAGRVHSRPVAGLPVPRPLVRNRADADRPRLRLSHRRDRWRAELHSLCGIADRADLVARRRPRPGLGRASSCSSSPSPSSASASFSKATSLRPSSWAGRSACIRSG